MLTNWLPFTYFFLFLIVAVGWRAYHVWRTTGVNALTAYNKDGPYGIASKLFRIVFVGIALVTIANVIPAVSVYLTPLTWFSHPLLQLIGWIMLTLALILVVIAQIQMGAAWRIGVDKSQNTNLVTNGIFQLSRNPIFLGIRFCFFGLLLVLPTAWTLMLWALGDAMIQVQVRLEEQYLLDTFGKRYKDYCATVRRWI